VKDVTFVGHGLVNMVSTFEIRIIQRAPRLLPQ
jgi:hypothetical protein